jgi:GWxTD domain-containing protein
MKRSRILSCAVLLSFFTITVLAADPSLPDLFKRAKEKFAAGDYKGSLADFELLDTNSAKPGFENDRAKLLPVVTFYRGANMAALGRKSEAKDAFIAYLGFVPTASIASPPFPKTTVDLFEQARNEAGTMSQTIAAAYAAFAAPSNWMLASDERWIETPVRYLLTPAQKKEYATFTSNKERAEFIDAFWRQLDPTPATDVNEFRGEFEHRLAFADANFATPKLPGRETERAAIFAFLGAPTYAALSQLSDDSMGRMRANGNHDGLDNFNNASLTPQQPLNPGDKVRPQGHNQINQNFYANETRKQDNLETDSRRAKREAWYYRAGRLPHDVPYKEVKFEFITKEGYGTAVLQKESEPMQTLGIAADAARRNKKLN